MSCVYLIANPCVCLARYEQKMEEMRQKFPNSAKMKAQYEVYQKKRLTMI